MAKTIPFRTITEGLTIREYFAGLALQGILAAPESAKFSPDVICKTAVLYADALITALNSEEES